MKKSVKIVITGDLMLGEWHFTRGFGINRTAKTKGLDYFFTEVSPIFKSADMVLGNLEGPVGPAVEASKNPLLANELFLPALMHAGMNVLSVANNHLMEYGDNGALYTIRKIDDEGFYLTGFIENPVRRIPVNGFVAQIIAADVLPIHHQRPPYGENPLMLSGKIEAVGDTICRSLQEMEADFRIVYLHWGEEFMPVPCPTQVHWAHKFVDYGADLVAGCHPHVPQTMEEYKGKVIAYSLGNLISDMPYPPTKEGFILALTFKEGGGYDYEIIPYTIDSDFRPVLMDDAASRQFKKKLEIERQYSYSPDTFGVDMENYAQAALQAENEMWDWVKKFYRRNFFKYPLSAQWAYLKEKLGL